MVFTFEQGNNVIFLLNLPPGTQHCSSHTSPVTRKYIAISYGYDIYDLPGTKKPEPVYFLITVDIVKKRKKHENRIRLDHSFAGPDVISLWLLVNNL